MQNLVEVKINLISNIVVAKNTWYSNQKAHKQPFLNEKFDFLTYKIL